MLRNTSDTTRTNPKYLDSPYFGKGDLLYRQRMTLADHLRLVDALRSASNWVLRYDRSPVIEELYRWANVHTFGVKYSVSGGKSAWANGEEMVIVPTDA